MHAYYATLRARFYNTDPVSQDSRNAYGTHTYSDYGRSSANFCEGIKFARVKPNIIANEPAT